MSLNYGVRLPFPSIRGQLLMCMLKFYFCAVEEELFPWNQEAWRREDSSPHPPCHIVQQGKKEGQVTPKPAIRKKLSTL